MTNQRKRKCKFCGEYVRDWISVPAGTFCNYDHAIQFANKPKIKAKAERVIHAEKKKKLRDNDRGYWAKSAQAAFNAYIRKRDEALPCISCQRHHTGQYHAGHYRSVGGNPELRFEPLNNNKQCMPCNSHLSGNLIDYRINLIKKIGQDKVDWLEGPHKAKRYTLDDLKEIQAKYKDKLKELLKAQDSC